MTDDYKTIEEATIEATAGAIKETGKRYFTGHIEFACKYGLNTAIIFDKLVRLHQYVNGKIDNNGNHWVRMTLEEWHEELPFWSINTIERVVNRATNGTDKIKPVFLSRTFSGRSKWYRCDPDCLSLDQDLSPQYGGTHHPNMGERLPQNGGLPNSLPNSVPSLSKEENQPQKPKPKKQQQKPTPADIEYYNQLSQELLTVCSLAVPLVNGTKLDFTGVIKFLQANRATPDMVRNFGQWYEKTPNLKAITENWKLFAEGKQPRHKQFNGKGARKNGNQQNGNGAGIKLTPEQQARADELNRQIEAAAAR